MATLMTSLEGSNDDIGGAGLRRPAGADSMIRHVGLQCGGCRPLLRLQARIARASQMMGGFVT